MTKAVLMSIQPNWCELIASGKKTIEVRKTCPKLKPPFKCYIYETRGKFEPSDCLRNNLHYDDITIKICESKGKVIGEFVCDKIFSAYVYNKDSSNAEMKRFSECCMTHEEIVDYLGNGKQGYNWYISNLVIYDEPKELNEFTRLRKTKYGYELIAVTIPPQSWYYVEEK